ncbi:hypothetical protein DYB32_002498 [Aphanomyces invadans]|uniref:Vacuolar protein sorting-associated protein 33B n=1 Tax=Aphanomyces invadans TaxID=157072 RepID=A0A418B375_9STRA|nr:hypothetical protein DYB32_002498 [Aphanomyces invadans]
MKVTPLPKRAVVPNPMHLVHSFDDHAGLLDSVIGIDHGTILHGIPKKKHVLDDDLFASIRNVDFQLVTSLLHDMSTSLQVDEAATRSTTSIDQLRIRAALAAAKTNLSLHVDLAHRVSNCSTDVKDVVSDDVDGVQRCVHAEQIILSKKLTATTPSSAVSSITGGADAAFVGTVLEEALFRDPPLELTKLIKLVCLHSLVHGGFKHATGRTKQRVLVYYIGGVTVAEIAAYRWLNQGQDQIQYVVACTAISNTARLLRQLVRSP